MTISISDFLREEAEKRARSQSAAAATIVMGSIDKSPDEAAGDLNLANDWAKETGKPVPPLPLVSEFRPVFQGQIEEKRNSTILAGNPKLTEWLRDPKNAALAKDSVADLAWWETALDATGNAMKRGVARVPQAYNQ